MSAPIFIGDEVSAAAYRLAGARTRTPVSEELVSTLRWARAEAPLVLLSAEYAEQLPPAELAQAMGALAPPVLIIPDVQQRSTPPDLAAALRRRLGMEAEP